MSGRVANTKDIIQFKNVKNRIGVKQEANASAKIELDEAMVDQVGTMKDVVAKVMNECMNEWMHEWMNEWMKEGMKEWMNGGMNEWRNE